MFAGAAGKHWDQAQLVPQAQLSLAAESQAWPELSVLEPAHLTGGSGAVTAQSRTKPRLTASPH